MNKYAEELKQMKANTKTSPYYNNVDKSIELLDKFCEKEDLLNVPLTKVFEIFDKFCDDVGVDRMPHKAVGRAIRLKYGFVTKVVRINGEVCKIYIENK